MKPLRPLRMTQAQDEPEQNPDDKIQKLVSVRLRREIQLIRQDMKTLVYRVDKLMSLLTGNGLE